MPPLPRSLAAVAVPLGKDVRQEHHIVHQFPNATAGSFSLASVTFPGLGTLSEQGEAVRTITCTVPTRARSN